jgi:hypothetical protein
VRILVTGAASKLGRSVAAELRRQRHRLRLTDRKRMRAERDFVQSQLGHTRSTDSLVAGMKAIVHIPGPARTDADEAEWIDACTRCTYNLLVAAVDAGVEHCIYLGSLDGFAAYDEDLRVSPQWRPRPTTEPEVMAPYLGEFVAREFAQTHQIRLTVLRLGHLVDADGIAEDDDLDPMALDPRDAAGAVAAAVQARPHDYRLQHLQGDFAGARFRSSRGRRHDSAFRPQHDFGRPRRDEKPGS